MITTYSIATINSAYIHGVEAQPATVEVSISAGIPGFHIVGLTESAATEMRSRIACAFGTAGISLPDGNILITIQPNAKHIANADVFDLAVALGLLIADKRLPETFASGCLVVGKTELTGEILPAAGMPCFADFAFACKLTLMSAPFAEIAWENNVKHIFFSNLANLAANVPTTTIPPLNTIPQSTLDYASIPGQEGAKRALTIAAAGEHNALLLGDIGSGKTMLATRFATILPPMTDDEIRQCARIYSAAGAPLGSIAHGTRPLRVPHHSTTLAGLVGGGLAVKPGEATLAHNGVLYLNALSEWAPHVLQTLVPAIEQKQITITRVDGTYTLPANIQLLASSQSCPCGFRSDQNRPCTCSDTQVQNYQRHLGEPISELFEMRIPITREPVKMLLTQSKGTSSAELREQVCAAREYRALRTAKETAYDTPLNSVIASCALGDSTKRLIAGNEQNIAYARTRVNELAKRSPYYRGFRHVSTRA